MALANTRSASPTPRWLTTTRPDDGRTDSGRLPRDRGERRRALRMAIEQGELEARENMAEDLEMASGLDAGTEQGDPRTATDDIRCIPGDRHTADRRRALRSDRRG